MQVDTNSGSAWDAINLGSVATIEVGGTPSTTVPAYWGDDIPWMSSGDVHQRRIVDVPGRIRAAGLRASNAKIIPSPAVAIALAGQGKTRGTVALTLRPLCTNQSVALVRGREGVLDNGYLFHALDIQYEDLRAWSAGGGRAGLSKALLEAVTLSVPPLPEQRHIAEILDTADRAIGETEALLSKLKRMKTGLMHDLLTRGVDESGQLRDPDAHPEQFKDSLLGRVPGEWEITTLGSVILDAGGFVQTGPFGSQLHAYEYVSKGVPVVMPQDIQDGHISSEQIARVTPEKASSLGRHRVAAGDVLFARRGDLERCAAIDEHTVGWLCGTGCLLVRPSKSKLDSRWLAAVYRHDLSQRQILARAVGTTMVNLNTGLLASLSIAKPSLNEQRRIAEILDAHDGRIRAEEAYRDKLKLQKKGLMEDLLTGRVRVKTTQEVGA